MSSSRAFCGTRSTTRSRGAVRKRIRVCSRVPSGARRNVLYTRMTVPMNRLTSGLYGWWRELLGAILVLASRVAIAPRTFWEHDELLFAQGVENFEPLRFHPHPPGYPLYILLGKFVNLFVHDIFTSLVWISIVSCVVGFLA